MHALFGMSLGNQWKVFSNSDKLSSDHSNVFTQDMTHVMLHLSDDQKILPNADYDALSFPMAGAAVPTVATLVTLAPVSSDATNCQFSIAL